MGIITKSQLARETSSFTKAFSLNESFSRSTAATTVFLSHKHSDLKEVKELKRLLLQLNVKIYVDWLDPDMPKVTRGETAVKIKQKIKQNKKFILLATDDAVDSKWCNWELGFGDGEKYKTDEIALFPLREDAKAWKGSEYMQIYPTIEYEDGTSKNNAGAYIAKGYYVFQPSVNGSRSYKSLKSWLTK